ncbi:hypothetical protein [Marininema halotolerans]|uniref:Uncharacterized protein n=1 Tax=Marininema halotolerans TaxID=1155944 RepID=A0A1I6UB22_9BACL|nr:hypothetical protein [Marininema halotolerans]SFS98568.1 hypothetical protein SAMN05444972_1156 [Marininema halotolerans]
MYLHGIPFVYLVHQYPTIHPKKETARRSPSHLADTLHLKRDLGFVPIHLLRTSSGYPLEVCIKECLRYGDTVFAFSALSTAVVQLSAHEWGVHQLTLEQPGWILTIRPSSLSWLQRHFPSVPIVLTQWNRKEKRKNRYPRHPFYVPKPSLPWREAHRIRKPRIFHEQK